MGNVLLHHFSYLESHKEWFNEDNYARSSSLKRTKLTDAKIETTVFQDQRQQQLEQQRHQNLVLSASLQDIQEDISTSLITNDTIIHSPQQPDAQINPSS